MRFSEAMMRGAKLRPQAFGVLFDRETGGSCALGAAAEAIGILDTTGTNRYVLGAKAPVEWKAVVLTKAPCPACDEDFLDVQEVVIHLNNDHRWSRELIALWVAGIERSLDEAQPADAAERQWGRPSRANLDRAI